MDDNQEQNLSPLGGEGNNDSPIPRRQAIERFLQLQESELQVRLRESEIRAKEVDSNKEIALASIAAQREDYRDNRDKFNKHLIHRYVFLSILALLVLGFFAFAIAYDAKELVESSLKIIGGFLAGGFGGYYLGRDRAQRISAPLDQPPLDDD